jgi:signal recognition particle GTPase
MRARTSSSTQSIDVPVFELGTDTSPVEIARRGIAEARRLKVDAVIVDTAGRLQVGGVEWFGVGCGVVWCGGRRV